MPQNGRHTLLSQHDQTNVDFYSVSDHFGTLCIKRSTVLHLSMQRFLILTSSKMLKILFLFLFFNEVYIAICFFYISSTAWKVSVFGVILVRLRSECSKIRTRIILNTDTFFSILAAFHTRWGSWKILKMISIAWCVSFWEATKSVQDMMAVANLPVVENACCCYAVQKKN